MSISNCKILLALVIDKETVNFDMKSIHLLPHWLCLGTFWYAQVYRKIYIAQEYKAIMKSLNSGQHS